LAEERRIALENVLAERNRTQQERKRADKAAIAVAIERSHAIAEKRRADMEAKRAQAMARAFAAQQPEVTATGPETVPDATAREYGLERNKGELFSPFWLFKLKPADADMVTRAGVTCVTIHAIDESDWHVEAVYRLGELEEGPVYRLQFQARADTSRDMEINIQIAGGTYRSIVSPRPKAHLSTTWRTYQYVVRPRGVGEQNQIAFFLGNKVGKVWLKNVSLKKETK
jgi:hypothetical protein